MTILKQKQSTYCTNIAMACDTSKLRYDPETGEAEMLPGATIPPRLARYAESQGHEMPDGIYGFFGEQGENSLKEEVLNHLKTRKKGDGFLWDVQTTLTFRKKPTTTKVATSLVWKDPTYLEGSFIRVGKPSKELADLLRYFTGDKHALDRLTLEPWRIDTYAAVLSEAYGNIRAIIFDAMMDDGTITPIVRVFDRSLIQDEGITPLYQLLSAKDPDQPTVYRSPDDSWGGWGVKEKAITSMDRADIIAFQSVPRERRKEREALRMRRIRLLRQDDRFAPREAELKEIVNRRLDNIRATSVSETEKRRKADMEAKSGDNTTPGGGVMTG